MQMFGDFGPPLYRVEEKSWVCWSESNFFYFASRRKAEIGNEMSSIIMVWDKKKDEISKMTMADDTKF